MEIVVFFVVLFAVVLTSIVVASRSGRRQRSGWSALAEELGGTFSERRGLFTSDLVLDAEVDETPVYVDTFRRSRNQGLTAPRTTTNRTFTRVCAPFVVPAGPSFRVFRAGLLTSLTKELGAQDIVLGDDDLFDETFVVKSTDPRGVRFVWTLEAQDLMLSYFTNATAKSDGDYVELTIEGTVQHEEDLRAAIHLVVELASADLFGLQAIESLPGADYEGPRGPWNDRSLPSAEVDAAVPVIVGPVADGDRAVTKVETDDAVEEWGTLFVDFYDDGTFEGARAKDLPDSARGLVGRLGDAHLEVDEGRAELWFTEIVTEQQTLQAAIGLVAAFGVAPRRGAYR